MTHTPNRAQMCALEHYPDLADQVIRDWSMAHRGIWQWDRVLLLGFGMRRTANALAQTARDHALLMELVQVTDLAAARKKEAGQ